MVELEGLEAHDSADQLVVFGAAAGAERDEMGLVCVCGGQGTSPCVLVETSYRSKDMCMGVAPEVDKPVLLCTAALEGTLVRMYCFGHKWMLSTHRKLDANKSRWGSARSFGQLFATAMANQLRLSGTPTLDEIASAMSLDPGYAHAFLVRPVEPAAAIACAPAGPGDVVVWYAGSVALRSKRQVPTFDLPFRAARDVPPVPRYNVTALSQALAGGFALPACAHGLLVFVGTSGTVESLVKVWLPGMIERTAVRGNEPDLLIRYLELFWQQSPDANMRQRFLNIYCFPEFAQADCVLARIAVQMANAYMLRFGKKKYVRVPPDCYPIFKTMRALEPKLGSKNALNQAAFAAIVATNPRTLAKVVRRCLA